MTGGFILWYLALAISIGMIILALCIGNMTTIQLVPPPVSGMTLGVDFVGS
jgi:hypothetical protein